MGILSLLFGGYKSKDLYTRYVLLLYDKYIFIHDGGKMEEYTLTKQVAKHGTQGIIVIPKVLDDDIKPGTLVELKIKVLKRPKEAN